MNILVDRSNKKIYYGNYVRQSSAVYCDESGVFFYYKLKWLLNKAIWISKKRGTQRESQIIPCCICSNANISIACCWCVVLKKNTFFPLHRENEQMMKILLLRHRAVHVIQ